MKKYLLIGGGIVLAFAIGFLPMYSENMKSQNLLRDTRSELTAKVDRLESQLRAERLGLDLSVLLVQVEERNFGQARQFSTKFFDSVRSVSAATKDPDLKHHLEMILARRDEITADLTRDNTEVVSKLRAMLLQLAALPQSEAATAG